MQSLTPNELQTLIEASDPSPVLIDVREPWEFEVCRIAGSRHLPMSSIPVRMNELVREAQTVVICHHGVRSKQVANYLERCGFTQVYNLEGGIDAWARDVDASVARY